MQKKVSMGTYVVCSRSYYLLFFVNRSEQLLIVWACASITASQNYTKWHFFHYIFVVVILQLNRNYFCEKPTFNGNMSVSIQNIQRLALRIEYFPALTEVMQPNMIVSICRFITCWWWTDTLFSLHHDFMRSMQIQFH